MKMQPTRTWETRVADRGYPTPTFECVVQYTEGEVSATIVPCSSVIMLTTEHVVELQGVLSELLGIMRANVPTHKETA